MLYPDREELFRDYPECQPAGLRQVLTDAAHHWCRARLRRHKPAI
jgi:hypothetical protein